MSTSSAASTAARRPRRTVRPPTRRGRYPNIRLSLFPTFLLLLVSLQAHAGTGSQPDSCSPDTSEPVSIRHVHDGDTVVRQDGERIRLIGIDTPELARDGRPAEDYALAARDRLRQLIGNADHISARYGQERRDRYGRLLAHLYADGRNLQAELLAAGLATPLFIAPNLGHDACYEQAAQAARDADRGIWQLPAYRPRTATSLTGNERGYHVITGTVQRVGRSRCCLWLNLDDDVALRIERTHLDLFSGGQLDDIESREVEARGFLYQRNDQLRMQIRHPADLVIMNGDDGK